MRELHEIREEGREGNQYHPEKINPEREFSSHFMENSDSPLSNLMRDEERMRQLEKKMSVFQTEDALLHFVLAIPYPHSLSLEEGRGWNVGMWYDRAEFMYLCCLMDGEPSMVLFSRFLMILGGFKQQWFRFFETNVEAYPNDVEEILCLLREANFIKIIPPVPYITRQKELVWQKAKRVLGTNSDVLRRLNLEVNSLEEFHELNNMDRSCQLKLCADDWSSNCKMLDVNGQDVFNSCLSQSWDVIVRESKVRFQIVLDFFSARLSDAVE